MSVTIDIKKVFDSLDHSFLLTTLEKSGCGTNFNDMIKLVLNDKKSCVRYKGVTRQYVKFVKSTRQFYPITA